MYLVLGNFMYLAPAGPWGQGSATLRQILCPELELALQGSWHQLCEAPQNHSLGQGKDLRGSPGPPCSSRVMPRHKAVSRWFGNLSSEGLLVPE